MDTDATDLVVRNTPPSSGSTGYSAHSTRAMFITTTLERGAQLEAVRKAAGHRDPSTIELYNRRGLQPGEGGELFCHCVKLTGRGPRWRIRSSATRLTNSKVVACAVLSVLRQLANRKEYIGALVKVVANIAAHLLPFLLHSNARRMRSPKVR
jgi:hypothetical protein